MKNCNAYLDGLSPSDLFYFFLYFKNMKVFVPDDEQRSEIARKSFEQIIQMDQPGLKPDKESERLLTLNSEQAYAQVFLTEYFQRTSN